MINKIELALLIFLALIINVNKINSIICYQCNTTNDENCLGATAIATECPFKNYTACSKFHHYSEGLEVVYRGCALKKLDDKCYSEKEDQSSKICLYWCDTNECNHSARLRADLFLYLMSLLGSLLANCNTRQTQY